MNVKDALDDLIKGCDEELEVEAPSKMPKVQKPKIQKPKGKFVKSIGNGGVVFDFGWRTGNPVADRATMALNDFPEPTEVQAALAVRNSFDQRLNEFVEMGESGFISKYNEESMDPVQMLKKGYDKVVHGSADEEVKRMYEEGTLFEEQQPKGATGNQYNKSEINIGGENIRATSETDAALIEDMKRSGMDMSMLEAHTVKK